MNLIETTAEVCSQKFSDLKSYEMLLSCQECKGIHPEFPEVNLEYIENNKDGILFKLWLFNCQNFFKDKLKSIVMAPTQTLDKQPVYDFLFKLQVTGSVYEEPGKHDNFVLRSANLLYLPPEISLMLLNAIEPAKTNATTKEIWQVVNPVRLYAMAHKAYLKASLLNKFVVDYFDDTLSEAKK